MRTHECVHASCGCACTCAGMHVNMCKCVCIFHGATRSRVLAAHRQAASDGNAQPCHNLGSIWDEDLEGYRFILCVQSRVGITAILDCTLQIPELYGLWDYRRKQKRKCASLSALKRAADGGGAGVLLQDRTVEESNTVKLDDAAPSKVRNESIEMSNIHVPRDALRHPHNLS